MHHWGQSLKAIRLSDFSRTAARAGRLGADAYRQRTVDVASLRSYSGAPPNPTPPQGVEKPSSSGWECPKSVDLFEDRLAEFLRARRFPDLTYNEWRREVWAGSGGLGTASEGRWRRPTAGGTWGVASGWGSESFFPPSLVAIAGTGLISMEASPAPSLRPLPPPVLASPFGSRSA